MDRSKKRILFVGFAFVSLAYMSIKLSAPALPLLSSVFDTNPIYLKLSASLYLVFFALSAFFWGAVAQKIPRRRVVTIALCLAIIGNVISLFSINVVMFIFGRIIEGCGMGGAATLCRVLMADRLERSEVVRVSLVFGFITSFMPVIAPTIGQYLIIWIEWRSIFAFFIVVLLAFGICSYFLLEETKKESDQGFRIIDSFHEYISIFKNPIFWAFISGFGLFVGTIIGYYIATPYWYLAHFKISAKYYTFLALFTAVPNVIAYYYGRSLVRRFSATGCIRFSYLLAPLGALLAAIIGWIWGIHPYTLIPPLMVMATVLGFIQPAVNGAIIHYFREKAGTAAALISVFGYGGAALMFFILTNIPLTTIWPFVIVLAVVTAFGLFNRKWLKGLQLKW